MQVERHLRQALFNSTVKQKCSTMILNRAITAYYDLGNLNGAGSVNIKGLIR